MQTITDALVRFATETRLEDLPDEVVAEAKRSLLDGIGCALAGTATDKGKIAVTVGRQLGGVPESTVLGLGDRLSCATAAFVNGELVNSLDHDAVSHIQPFIIPPALAVAERVGASGGELILAYVLGQEISKRLMLGLSNMIAKLMDDHRTPDVFGNSNECVLGGAAAAGRLLALSDAQMAHALGLAGYLCPLPTCRDWEEATPKSMVKYAPVGWICQASATSALLAKQGYTGNPAVLDGPYGFPRFYGAERWAPDVVVDGLGARWRFLEVNYKPYPCCRFFHSQLDCFIRILEENDLRAEEIGAVRTYGMPFVANQDPTNVQTQVDVQFSLPFVLAAAAHRVRVGADWQAWETIRDPRLRAFTPKVTMLVDPKAIEEKRKDPRSWYARVEVDARGRTYTAETLYAKGTAGTPLRSTDEELEAKFRANAARLLTPARIDEAVGRLSRLEELRSVAELAACLVL